MRDGLPGDTVTALLEGADGSVWIGTSAGLARLERGRASVVRADLFRTDSIRALFEGRDGALWVATTGGGLKILRDGHVTVWDARAGLSDVVRSFYEDRNGTVRVGSDAGLSRYVNGRFETFGVAQGVFRKDVMTITGDPRYDLGRHVRRRPLQVQGRSLHALLHGQRSVRRHRVSDRR
jgi:ligand-binding sensor domain-containing protein